MSSIPISVTKALPADRMRDIAIAGALVLWLAYTRLYWVLQAAHIAALVELMEDTNIPVGTLRTPVTTEEIANPNSVKVVTDLSNRALYFSRSTIPYDRDGSQPRYFKHLGIYAYRKAALERFVTLPESSLERAERLEQLRFLENGIPIYAAETPHDSIGVDTEEDFARVLKVLS